MVRPSNDFTSGVMGRLPAVQHAPPPPARANALERVRRVGSTIGLTSLIVLAASCLFAILEPAMAITLLGAFVSLLLLLLATVRAVFGLVHAIGTNGGATLLVCLALIAFVLVAWSRVVQRVTHVSRES